MSEPLLDGCHCCEGQQPPAAIHNAPGLPALSWRLDTYPGFHQRMLASLPLWRAPLTPATTPRPLAALTTREPGDPTLAFTDAAACVADVLSFYQERIANEGFLRTATERRSVLELARAVGYALRPGVAAGVHLVFTVEDASGAPGICTIAAGSPVQSVPPQGKLPQVFETSAELLARAEWNALRPRQTRPADFALVEVDGKLRLALLHEQGALPAATEGLLPGLASAGLFRLDPGLPVHATVDALPVARVYLTGQAGTVQAGDLLLFVGKNGRQLKHLVLRVLAVEDEPALRRVRVDLQPLPDPVTPTAMLSLVVQVQYAAPQFDSFGHAPPAGTAPGSAQAATAIANQNWRESDLQAVIATQAWSGQQLVQAVRASFRPPARPVAPEAGVFSFGARLGFFGHNAPKWASLPRDNLKGDAYPEGWDQGDGAGGSEPSKVLLGARTIWVDSQGKPLPSCHALLERPVPQLAPGSWMVFDSPSVATATYTLYDARETARADFGLSGRAMALRLADGSGAPLELKDTPEQDFKFRDTTAHVASRRQPLAELPIEAGVAAGSTRVELSTMVLGLARGKLLAFVGPRDDLPGVDAAEIAVVDEVLHGGGRSVLVLREGLAHGYRRDGLVIHANVAPATHGESVQEVLGSGDASRPFQRFTLARPPTTHVSAPTASGVSNTLELRVNGLLWTERPSLHGAGPDQHVYATRIDNDARMHLLFGDGGQGARLPTGQVNVQARYRSGLGADGEVAAGSLTMLRAMPLGLRGVTNPLPASGAEDPESLAGARRNAPLTLLAFERVVSLSDYQDFARAFPGIGKARADLAWVGGGTRVLLSVMGATGGIPGAQVLDNLRQAIAELSDGSQSFEVAAAVLRHFRCTARVAIDPRHEPEAVLAAAAARLKQAFGFEARELAQAVTAAELLALLHQVPGVVAVDLDLLQPHDGSGEAGPVAQVVPAFGARREHGAMRAAELLLLNPAALELVGAAP